MILGEHDKHEQFERVCGGPDRAFRLMRLWENCANPVGGFLMTEQDKHDKRLANFRKSAIREGYTPKQIALFLDL